MHTTLLMLGMSITGLWVLVSAFAGEFLDWLL
jgi:hypothetical protein